jgi:hypothetical protein
MQQLTLCRQTGRKSTSDEMPDSTVRGVHRVAETLSDVQLYPHNSTISRTYVRYYTVMRSCITQRDRREYPSTDRIECGL